MARPEGLEPPTTWFEVTSTNSTIQLEQSLATLAAFANPTYSLFLWFTKWHSGTNLALVAIGYLPKSYAQDELEG